MLACSLEVVEISKIMSLSRGKDSRLSEERLKFLPDLAVEQSFHPSFLQSPTNS
jgi:hypothetical protein